jgi:hypothetical protein
MTVLMQRNFGRHGKLFPLACDEHGDADRLPNQ